MTVRKFAAFRHVEEGNFWRHAGSSLLLAAVCLVMVSCSSSSSSGGGSSPAPTATLTATPSSVFTGAGTTVTLAFTSTNANSGTLSGQGTVGINSMVTIPEPTATTIYTYTATGPGGTAMASATVTVNAAPLVSVTLTASPTAALAGTSLTLTWASQNATSVTISGVPVGTTGVKPASGGDYSFTPTATTTYTATAYGADGQQPVTSDVKVPINAVNSFNGLDSTVPGGSTEDDIDPNGAVGTKQFMEYVNLSYQGYDKTTFAPVWSQPQAFNTPWTGKPHCAGTKIQLDGVVIFDRLASRWVVAAKTTVQNEYYFCIAVSNTDDLSSPTFAWYPYYFDLSSYLKIPGQNATYLPDWPKLATWWNGYYAGMDMVDVIGGAQTENGALLCAFDRTNMLAGTPLSTSMIQCQAFEGSVTGGYLSHSPIPADVDGTTPPPNGRDEYMLSIQNPPVDNQTTTSSSLNLWDCQLNWSPASFSCLQSTLPVQAYTPGCYLTGAPAQTDCVQEPGLAPIGGLEVDSIGDRLMPRFAYRNFGSYESFLISHTVQTNLGSGQDSRQTGIRWYELQANGSGAPTVSQSGTITPDNSNFRFMPSIAQDKTGNVVVGYSLSSPQTNPGINASYWNRNGQNGPPTTPAEVTILNGPGEEIPMNPMNGQISNFGQWGSYATITVDPTDDCTFWYVNEYWPANTTELPGPWSTNISYFQVPGCQ